MNRPSSLNLGAFRAMATLVISIPISLVLMFSFNADLSAHSLIIKCKSRWSKKRCPVKVKGKVRLIRQLSRTKCRRGRTWGYNRNGIWVKRGCKGRFKVGHVHPKEIKLKPEPAKVAPKPVTKIPLSNSRTKIPDYRTLRRVNQIYCASDNKKYKQCDSSIRGKARLIHQFSTDTCRFGISWGFSRKGIWVDRGCVGLFRLLPPRTAIQTQVIRCESSEQSPTQCPAPYPGDAQLMQRLSSADCTKGDSWDYGAKGLWVKNGCQALFKVIYRGNLNRVPQWLLGRFNGLDQWNNTRLFVDIQPYGVAKARKGKTSILAELNGDILTINEDSFVIKKTNEGFSAAHTRFGHYQVIQFRRK